MIKLAAFVLAFAATAQAQTCLYVLKASDAKGDDVHANTSLIQQDIDRAASCHGTVLIETGTFRIGSLFLKSNATLRLEKGVVLLGSQDIKDYPEMPTRVAGIEMTWPAALINVYKQTNATITGEGTIDGDGKIYWDSYWALRKIDDPKGLRWASDYDAKRPRLIQIFDSSNIKLGGGLTLKRSGFWTVHICYSHDVTVDGLIIRNNEGGHGPSTDGIDIDSSKKILVTHADIEANDDALCLKAGRDADGLRVNRPTEDVVIRDSIIRNGAAGVTFGSETSGGFRNIEIYGVHTLSGVPAGILFKSSPMRGGFGEDIRIHDMVMEGTPTVLRMTMNWNPNYSTAKIPDGMQDVPSYYTILTTPVPEAKGIAHFHDIHIWNIKATGAKAAFDVNGNPTAPVERVKLDHLDIEAQSAGHIAAAGNWAFSDTNLHITDGSSVDLKGSVNVTGLPKAGTPSKAKPGANAAYEE